MVTREVHRSSLRRLICPAQDHFIFVSFSTSLRCIRRIYVRVCMPLVLPKKLEKKRRLDNAVAGTSKIRSFFVTTTLSEGTTWTGSSRVRPDARQPDGSRALFQLGAISSENGNRRIFSETHYHAHSGLWK